MAQPVAASIVAVVLLVVALARNSLTISMGKPKGLRKPPGAISSSSSPTLTYALAAVVALALLGLFARRVGELSETRRRALRAWSPRLRARASFEPSRRLLGGFL